MPARNSPPPTPASDTKQLVERGIRTHRDCTDLVLGISIETLAGVLDTRQADRLLAACNRWTDGPRTAEATARLNEELRSVLASPPAPRKGKAI